MGNGRILLIIVFTAMLCTCNLMADSRGNCQYAALAGNITGTITNRQGEAVDLATIVLKDSLGKTVAGCTSDSLGHFVITNVPEQARTLFVSCLGYKDCSYAIKTGQTFFKFVLDTSTTALQEVTVTSKVPLIKREADRIVVNAEKLNAIATSFLDVLKHTPGVLVQDEDISMLGKNKILFFMDDRQIKMDMKALIVYLNALPSNNLKAIELMKTPPAKYSAEGDAGVINFVTRKLQNNYLGGLATNKLSIKEHVYDDAGVSLQYKRDQVEAYVNTGFGLGKMDYKSSTDIDYLQEKRVTDSQRKKDNGYVIVTTGIDYILTPKSTLGAIFSYNYMSPDAVKTGKTSVWPQCDIETMEKQFETYTTSKVDYNRYNANIHYQLAHIGQKGRLNVDADYLNYHIEDAVHLETAGTEDLSYLNRPRTTIKVYQAKADLTLPFKKSTVSCGTVYTRSTTENLTNYQSLSLERDLNDHFLYKEGVWGSYADIKIRLSQQWNVKAGLRTEYGVLDGHSLKLNQQTVKHQLDLFPTFFVGYEPDEDNSFSLSVSSRINRPNYSDINPFTTYVDANTITTGNPNLLPEKSYVTDLGYSHGDFSVSANITWRNRAIADFTRLNNQTHISTTTIDNIMKKQMYSLDLSYYFDKLKWLYTDIEGDFYTIYSQPVSNLYGNKTHCFSAFLYMNNNVYFNQARTLVANLWGQYQAKEEDAGGTSPSRYRVDFGLKWLLLQKKLSIGIEMRNLLASAPQWIVVSDGAVSRESFTPYRVFTISLSYKFGKKLDVEKKDFKIDSDRL